MKMMLKNKRFASGIMVAALLFSLSPASGMAAAPFNKKEEGAFALSNASQYKPVNSHAFNLIQNSPILYASIANSSEHRVIVTFKDKKKMNKSLIQKGKGKIKRENKHTPSLAVTMTSNEIETLKNDPAVESVEPDIQLQTAAQTMDWGVSVVNATYAWNNGYTGKGVKVAVLDSGIDTHHEDLVVAGGASFVDYTTSFDDDFGHGTHVAGIIGAKNNNIGIVGVAPDADLFAVKVLDSTGKGYLSDVIAGIDWAVENKMDIINMSMATGVDSPALHHAVDQAYASGLLVVAAAGNTGNAEGTGVTIQYPAKYSSVISVGAVDQNHQRASFSATGSELEIVAPGAGITSTFLSNGYSEANGTSVATPFVAGELALLKQQSPKLGNQQIRSLLDMHVTELGVEGKDSLYGYGLLDIANTSSHEVNNTVDPTVTDDVYNNVYGNIFAAISPTGVVTVGAPPPVNTGFAGLSSLLDGRILCTTWTNIYNPDTGNFDLKNYVYIYDPNTNIWTTAANFPTAMSDFRQSTLNDGRVLVVGKDHSYIYNPSTNSWSQAASLPNLFGISRFFGFALSTLKDGRVLATGGGYDGYVPTKVLDYAFVYNPNTNQWSTVASLPYPIYNHAQSTLVDGRVLVSGGVVCSDGCIDHTFFTIYDPNSNTWTERSSLPFESYGQVTLSDGRVFILTWTTSYLYDVTTKSAVQGPTLPYASYGLTKSYLPDGRVIAISSSNTYIVSFNTPPTITVNNNNQTVWSQAGYQTISLSGNSQDKNNDSLTISANFNGVTKSTVVVNTSSNPTWTLQWDINTDHIPAGTYTNIPITVNDGNVTTTINYTGTIIVAQAPYAPSNVSPGNSNSSTPMITSATPTLSWIFADPDSGDTQSAYEVLIYNAAGTTLINDSGWVSSAANSYTVPAGKLSPGATYSWLVKVKDSKGAISPNSASLYIRINKLPTLSLTSFTDGQQVSDNVLNFTWAYGDADGQAQKAYQVLGSQNNWATVGYNSGIVSLSNTSMLTPALASGTWSFKVLVSDGIDWSVAALRNNLLLPNAFEPNDTNTQAYAINYNQNYTSLLGSAADIDFFKYTASTTGADRFTMTVPSGLNYDVYIYDSGLNLIAVGVKGASLAENVLYDVTTGTTYYIKIVGVGGNYSTSASYGFTLSKFTMQLQTNYQYDSNGNITGKTTTKSN
ncbi:S8 family serine peptidase [Paenibacillus sp. SI8]|uniref:S8 family serine peptidase n=1 Tax=unclassified Paenibacillus TaxID=185978 RepID=UPI0034669C4F